MQTDDSPDEARVLLVMGVSGSGKTTVASLLADRLGWAFAEGDSFHPPANLAKMAAGEPLDDADRVPWLAGLGAFIDATTAAGRSAVVSCSGLKRSYRETLRRGRDNVRAVFLDAPYATVRARLGAREGHFFPADLLASQYRDLEPPGPDEGIPHVSIEGGPDQIVERIIELGVTA